MTEIKSISHDHNHLLKRWDSPFYGGGPHDHFLREWVDHFSKSGLTLLSKEVGLSLSPPINMDPL